MRASRVTDTALKNNKGKIELVEFYFIFSTQRTLHTSGLDSIPSHSKTQEHRPTHRIGE